MIKVAVCGSSGKMGKEIVKAVTNSDDMELTAQIDITGGEFTSIEEAVKVKKIDVLVDFTKPDSIFNNALYCLNNGIKIVIGTTGLSDNEISQLQELSKKNSTACLIAPNFSTGAVLMMKFAKMASKYFNNAEIIELHHNQKKDAPSGTSVKTAKMMSEENSDFTQGNCPEIEILKGARGGVADNNIHIHSIRMPGYIASQEVLFGASGQILTIRHDSMNRECYMQGVLLGIRHAYSNNDFVYGLENIL